MDRPLTVVARIRARRDRVDELRAALDELIHATRQEPGCVAYDLHVGADDPTVFVFHETWSDRTSWERHNASAHIQRFRGLAEGLVDGEIQVDPVYRVD